MVPEVQGVPEVSVLWVQKVRFAGSGSSASDASHCFFRSTGAIAALPLIALSTRSSQSLSLRRCLQAATNEVALIDCEVLKPHRYGTQTLGTF